MRISSLSMPTRRVQLLAFFRLVGFNIRTFIFILLIISFGTPVYGESPPPIPRKIPLLRVDYENRLGLLLAGTSKIREGWKTAFTLGMDYERRVTQKGDPLPLGFGVFGEAVFFDTEEVLFGVPIFLHPPPAEGWFFQVAPGVEIKNLDDPVSHFLLRTGIGYDKELHGISIASMLNLDAIRGDPALTFGISIGAPF